jgi:hypothetical protein
VKAIFLLVKERRHFRTYGNDQKTGLFRLNTVHFTILMAAAKSTRMLG